jgi:acyl-CoA thioester hydrolase
MGAAARTRVPIRWRDLDILGHLNQSVYHELLEESRGQLFASLDGHAFPFVLVHVELDYRHEVRHQDRYVEIETRVVEVGNRSVTVEDTMFLPDGTVAAEGRSVLVAWDMDARTSRPLTDTERAALAG